MIGLSRVGDASVAPVTLAELRDHLRITHTDEDTLLSIYLDAASDAVSERSGQVMGLETWTFKTGPVSGDLFLPRTPVRALTELSWIAPTGDVVAGDPADFMLIDDPARPFLRPLPGKAWPSVAGRPDATSFTFTAGLMSVPQGLKVAVLMLAGHFYETAVITSGGAQSEPAAVESLINLHRVGWAAA